MSAYKVSLSDRRFVLLAVMSLVASLLAIGLNAPAARAGGETVDFTAASTSVAEDGTSVTATLELSQTTPELLTADVVVAVTVTDIDTTSGDYTYTGSTETFLTGVATDGSQIPIVIPIFDDTDHEGDEDFQLDLSVTSGGSNGSVTTIVITITDDDLASVEFTETSSSITEQTTTHSPTLTLTVPDGGTLADEVTVDITAPTGDAIGGGVDYSIPATVTINAGSADGSTHEVNVGIIEDLDHEANEEIGLSMAVSGGTAEDGTDTAHTVTINDDDDAIIQFAATTSTIAEGDSGSTGHTVTVELTVPGGGTLVGAASVDVTDAGTGSAIGTDYTFTSPTAVGFDDGDTSGTSKTVTVNVTGDELDETDETVDLDVAFDSGRVAIGTNSSHEVTITDDDTLGVTVTPTTLNLTETGEVADTYDVVLDSEPTATVTITIDDSAAAGEYTVDKSSLTFLTSNWDTEQTVTVTPVDDAIDDGDSSSDITHSASGGDYAGEPVDSVTVNVTDDEGTPALTIDSPASVDETGNLTFTVGRSGSDTVAPIIFSYTTVDTGSATADTDYTTTTGTGSIPATGGTDTIDVPILTDGLDEGDETFEVSVTVTSANAGDPANGTGTITDDDTAGVTISETTVAAVEGGTEPTYTVVLDSEPTADVTITLSADGAQATAGATVDGATILTFTPSAGASPWNVTQSVTVTAVDDDIDDDGVNDNISHTAASTDIDYVGDVGDVEVTITDEDVAGVLITPTSVSATEGGADGEYTVELTSEPVDDVTITLSLVNGGEFSVDDSTLDFDDSNWDVAQTVTVSADDDAVADGTTSGTINHAASSATDPDYTGSMSITSVGVTIIDDESPNISIVGSPVATEGGANGTYEVVLTTQPSSDVTVTLSIASGGSEFEIVGSSSLIFTISNYDDPQTVTVRAIDDDVIDGPQMGEINHSASDGGYDGVDDQPVEVTVQDDDVAGITITETSGSTEVIEGGAADTYRVMLDAEPGANVAVSVSFDPTQLSVTPATLTFTPANWDVFQEFSVSGVQDNVEELDIHSVPISHTVTTTDTDFAPVAVASVVVDITDSDELEISIEGPSYGAPGAEMTFEAVQNAIGTGDPTYSWTLLKNYVDTGISGSQAVFKFTPADGGLYQLIVHVEDDLNEQDFFIDPITVLGDIGGHTFTNNILWLAEQGITKGCNPPVNDEFCPNDYVTRGQMAAFLVRFLGLTDNGGGDLFTDDDTSIFENNIDKLATAGITRGCNPPANTNFCPEDRVTRGQMAAFLVRALELTDNGGGDLFTDDNGHVFEENIDRLATAGITRGCNPPANTNFCPDSYVTRGQMAAFLQRASSLLP